MRSLLVLLAVAIIAASVALLLTWAPDGDPSLASPGPQPSARRRVAATPAAPEGVLIVRPPPLARSVAPAAEGPKPWDVDVSNAVPPEVQSHTPTLTARAVDGAGTPIPGAFIGIRSVGLDLFHDREETDDAGEARFEVRSSLRRQPLLIWATAPGRGLASREIELAAIPEEQPFVLVLEAGGWLDVTVLESLGGLPVEGAVILVSIVESTRHIMSRSDTDSNGFAALGPLVGGLRSWYVGAPGAEHNVRGAIEILPGQRRAIEVALDQDGEPLALEGVFVDENNVARPSDYFSKVDSQPIDRPTLWVGPSRAEGKIVHADAYGRFRVHMPPCDELLVLLNMGPNGHRYDPESMTVPFGTRGLRLRVSERYESVTTRFVVRDDVTGKSVAGATVIVYRDDPWKAKESCLTRSDQPGSYAVHHRDWPDLRYVVRSIGHEHVYGVLDGSAREDRILVRVHAGLRSPVVVLDDATLRPIEGARFVNQAGDTIATSDVQGAAALAGDGASGRLRVVADGYAPRSWYASWPTPRVTLVQE